MGDSPFEEALVSRRVASVLPEGEVSILEVWDLKHPQCPFVSFQPIAEPFLWRKVFASQQEFSQFKIDLK